MSRFNGLLLGFLHILESVSKPVIVIVNYNENGKLLKEGDIFYRYSAQTRRILYHNLRELIDTIVEKKCKRVLNQISRLVTLGPDQGAVLDLLSGDIETSNSQVRLVVPHEVLQELNLIEEGRIVEKDGAPAYTIKGFIHPEATTIIEKPVSHILDSDTVYQTCFIRNCSDPNMYIRYIISGSIHYYPIYFFIYKSETTIESTIELINSLKGKRGTNPITANKIIDKLKNGSEKSAFGTLRKEALGLLSFDLNGSTSIEKQVYEICSNNEIRNLRSHKIIVRTYFFQEILEKKPLFDKTITEYLVEACEAFAHLDSNFIRQNEEYIFSQLQAIYSHIGANPTARTVYRKIICLVDEVLYRDKCIGRL